MLSATLLGALLMAPGIGFSAAPYADPLKPALPASTFQWDMSRTALVVIGPQVDFMSPKGAGWPVFGQSVTEQHLVPNLDRPFAAFKKAGATMAISPHYYPHDHKWAFEAPAETFSAQAWPLRSQGSPDTGWIPQLGRRFHAGVQTLHRRRQDHRRVAAQAVGPQSNDLTLQLRKQRIDKIVLAGMASKGLCQR